MFVGGFPCVFWGGHRSSDIWPTVLRSSSPNLNETSGLLASLKQNHLQEEPSGVGDRTDLSECVCVCVSGRKTDSLPVNGLLLLDVQLSGVM